MSEKKLGLKPLGDRVVIKPVEQESRTESGLYIPDRNRSVLDERVFV